MATFIFKINQRTVELSDLPKGSLKDLLESFWTIIDNQFGALCCQTHNFKPIITLDNDANQVRISDLNCCCQGLTSKAVELIKAVGLDTRDLERRPLSRKK